MISLYIIKTNDLRWGNAKHFVHGKMKKTVSIMLDNECES